MAPPGREGDGANRRVSRRRNVSERNRMWVALDAADGIDEDGAKIDVADARLSRRRRRWRRLRML